MDARALTDLLVTPLPPNLDRNARRLGLSASICLMELRYGVSEIPLTLLFQRGEIPHAQITKEPAEEILRLGEHDLNQG